MLKFERLLVVSKDSGYFDETKSNWYKVTFSDGNAMYPFGVDTQDQFDHLQPLHMYSGEVYMKGTKLRLSSAKEVK